jgi:hypothetical protein
MSLLQTTEADCSLPRTSPRCYRSRRSAVLRGVSLQSLSVHRNAAMSLASSRFASYANWCRKTDIQKLDTNGNPAGMKKFVLRCLIYVPKKKFSTEFMMDVGETGTVEFTTFVPFPPPPHKVTVTAPIVKTLERFGPFNSTTPGIFEIAAPNSVKDQVLVASIQWQTMDQTKTFGGGTLELTPLKDKPVLPRGIAALQHFFSSSKKTDSGTSVDYSIGISKVSLDEPEFI